MPSFELIARRTDVEQREYPVGYRFGPTRDGVVWVVQDIERDGDTIRHVCRLEAAKPESETTEELAAPPD